MDRLLKSFIPNRNRGKMIFLNHTQIVLKNSLKKKSPRSPRVGDEEEEDSCYYCVEEIGSSRGATSDTILNASILGYWDQQSNKQRDLFIKWNSPSSQEYSSSIYTMT